MVSPLRLPRQSEETIELLLSVADPELVAELAAHREGRERELFALTALLLSLTGLYAVLAFYVGRRTREIGIRVAFGATGGNVSGMILRRGVGLVGVGLLLGLAGAVAATRILQSQLYEVGAMDPLTFGSVGAGFLLVGCLASLVPAWRATRIDPVRAIQEE